MKFLISSLAITQENNMLITLQSLCERKCKETGSREQNGKLRNDRFALWSSTSHKKFLCFTLQIEDEVNNFSFLTAEANSPKLQVSTPFSHLKPQRSIDLEFFLMFFVTSPVVRESVKAKLVSYCALWNICYGEKIIILPKKGHRVLTRRSGIG